VGNAVVRNKVRRRLKESIRALDVRQGWDIVLSAKTSAAAAPFIELNEALIDLFSRAELRDVGSQGALS
jgi:ribonuclease P protein component